MTLLRAMPSVVLAVALGRRSRGCSTAASSPTTCPCPTSTPTPSSASSSSTTRSATSGSSTRTGPRADRALRDARGVRAGTALRYARESAAGPIGTGMLLGMLGLAIVWIAQLPFTVAALWWQRRHDVSEVGYFEYVFGDWLALGGTFVAVCLALLIVMALARWLGVVVVDPGRRRLRRRSSRCWFSSARTSSPTSSPWTTPRSARRTSATSARRASTGSRSGSSRSAATRARPTRTPSAWGRPRGSCSGTRCSTDGSGR